MSAQIRFISDLHFGHRNMAINRGFKDEFEHDEYIIKKWNEVVHKRDTIYILGDITMEKTKWYFRLDELKGIKKVILGNHDKPQHVPELLKYVNNVSGMLKYKDKQYSEHNFFLTHCPIHESELDYRVKYNIHGHVHENTISKYKWNFLSKVDKKTIDPRYINVCCEAVNYTPKTIKELLNGRE